MPFDPIEELLNRIRSSREWPLRSEAATWRRVLAWRAFLECDREALKIVADWRDPNREYKVDGLGETIADTWADHLFSEDLEVSAAAAGDQDRLDTILGDTFTEDCRSAERDYVASEGEGWWRVVADPTSPPPRTSNGTAAPASSPYYVGARLLAVALVKVLEGAPNVQSARNAVFRHFEIHAEGITRHVVFQGNDRRLGRELPLDAHPETEDLAATLGESGTWAHGLPMLMGRVINKRGRRATVGISEYETVKDQLLDLNEAETIGAENARLTAKKRAIVPSSAVQAAPTRPNGYPAGDGLIDDGEGGFVPANGRPVFNAGEDLLVIDPVNEELGRDGTAPFTVLEYSFDAEALIAYKRDKVETALTRLRITPQWIGVQTGSGDGYAVSGTSLRLRAIPTTRAGNSKGKQWDKALPQLVRALQRLDALPEADGGFGQQWAQADEPPGVKRGNPMPNDEVEEATIEATLVGAGVKSVRQSVRDQHPEWTDEDVDAEVARIRGDRAAAPALGGFA
jgi:hypothetical protein